LPGKARRLIGWDKRQLAPGESRTITVIADRRLLADFDTKAHLWKIMPATVRVEVAQSATSPVLVGKAFISAGTIKP